MTRSPRTLTIRVLGSGTSTGVPVIGCRCPVCTSTDPRNRRLRSSVAVEVDGRHLLIDCSTDFRQQMLRDPVPRIDAVLLTHTHSDHISGIDDLRIFNYRQGGAIPVFTTDYFIADLRTRFSYAFTPTQMGGGVPQLELTAVAPGTPFVAAGVEVLPVQVMHGRLPILGFRIGPFAYVTDCSGLPDATIQQLRGVDTLILSALRPEPHETHFSLGQALEAATLIAPRRVYFTHIADRLDHETTNRELPPWAALLYDGQVIEVEADRAAGFAAPSATEPAGSDGA